jgi:ribosome-associated protein
MGITVISSENYTVRLNQGGSMSLDQRFAVIVEAALSKKAFQIKLIDVTGIASFTNTIVFMCGSSDRHNRAVSEAIIDAMRIYGERCLCVDGAQNGDWILLDYGDLIINIMSEETRRFYNLEDLWQLGREIEIPC